MPKIRRTILAAAGGGILLLGLAPAVPAAASSGNPADCTQSTNGLDSISLTCTNRPANQMWWAQTACVSFRVVYRDGNTVTGDGTSTINCAPAYDGGAAWFDGTN